MIGPTAKILTALGALVPAALAVYSQVEAALADGEISGDEAAAIGHKVAVELGDVRVLVRGRDILHTAAQQEILGGVARICRQIVLAYR